MPSRSLFHVTFCVLLITVVSGPTNAQELVVDLASGHGNAAVHFIEFNDALYFAGYDQRRGTELWRYHPDDGATLVADIFPGQFNSSAPSDFTVAHGLLYFEASSGPETGRELWAFDGDGPPSMVADLVPGENCGCPRNLIEFGGDLYFTTYIQTGIPLWKFDGTGTPEHLFPAASHGEAARDFAVFDDHLYFSAQDEYGEHVLWRFDGQQSPEIVFPEAGDAEWASVEELAVFNGGLIYSANSRMWWYDGHSDPVHVASSEYDGNQPGSPSGFTEFEGRVYFEALHPDVGFELWEWDGTSEPSVVADLSPGQGWTDLQALTVAHGVLYFSAHDALWAYDGESAPSRVAGVQQFGEIGMIAFRDEIVFPSYTDESGFELWSYDGSGEPALLADTDLSGDADPQHLRATSEALFFSIVSDPTAVYRFDGTDTRRMSVNQSTDAERPPLGFTEWNGSVFFIARNEGPTSSDVRPRDIHRYGEGSESVFEVSIHQGSSGSDPLDYPDDLMPFDGSLFFAGNDGSNGFELWKWDGMNPPEMVQDIHPGPGSSMPRWFTEFDGSLYFSADDGTGGPGLWKYTPGHGADLFHATDITTRPVVQGGRLYFRGTGVWEYDGTRDPVRIQIELTPSTFDRGMAPAGSTLFFTAQPVENHQGMWSYNVDDGLASVDLGVEHWTIEEPVGVGESVCFRGYRNAYDPELECFDPERNLLFRFDLNPYGFSDPAGFTVFRDHLYFSADDGIHGTELFRLPISMVSERDTMSQQPDAEALLVDMFPNPVVSELTIGFDRSAFPDVRVELFDAVGRRIKAGSPAGQIAGRLFRIDLSDLSPGVYFVRVRGGGIDLTRPVVKSR